MLDLLYPPPARRAPLSIPGRRLGVALVAVLLCSTAVFSAPVKIVAISVEGNAAISLQQVLETIAEAAVVGQEVEDLDACLAKVTQLLVAHGRFSKVDVKAKPAQGGQEILISLAEYAVTKSVSFTGNTVLTSEQLAKAVPVRAGLLLKPQMLTTAVERIEAAYDDAGASALVTDVNVTEDAEVGFVIKERYVEQFRCEGLQVITCDEVRQIVGVRDGAPLVQPVLTEGLRRLKRTGWFEEVGLELSVSEKDPNAGIIVSVALKETADIVGRTVGHPLETIDSAKLRRDVSVIRVDARIEVSFSVNDYLLDLRDDLTTALERLSAGAEAVNTQTGGPDQAAALLEYGLALSAAERDEEARRPLTAAAEMYRRLLAADPTDGLLAVGLGRCLSAAGEYTEAMAQLSRAIELSPQRWEPRVYYAQCVGDYVLREHARALASLGGTTESVTSLPTTRAVVELSPWPGSRDIILAALGAEGEPDALTQLAREAVAQLQEARRLAPGQVLPVRTAYSLLIGSLVTAGPTGGRTEEFFRAFARDAEQFRATVPSMAENDPGVALWSAFCGSLRALLLIACQDQGTGTGEQIAAEFKTLAGRLDELVRKWPHALRVTGNALGLLQLLANETEMAKATFEEAIKLNPYDRNTYDALLGIAVMVEDWPEVEHVVRRRMAANPAAVDHVLLGKALNAQGKDAQTVLDHFKAAIIEYPQDPIGYVATAGWLVHVGTDDAEATAMLDKGLELDPKNAYGHAVRAALLLLQGKGEEAGKSLARALRADPKNELAQAIRRDYFSLPGTPAP